MREHKWVNAIHGEKLLQRGAANPPVDTVSIAVDRSPVISGDTVIVTDSVLTIPSVQRSHSGNYSCTATNTRGSAVIYQYVLVTDSGERAEVNFKQYSNSYCLVWSFNTTNNLLWLMRQTLLPCGGEWIWKQQRGCGGPAEWGGVVGVLCCAVCALAGLHMSQSHDYSLVMPTYTSGQPSSVSDTVTVADMSSAVIGLSVTVAIVIVICVTIVIISLVVAHHCPLLPSRYVLWQWSWPTV